MTDLQAKRTALKQVRKWHRKNVKTWQKGYIYAPYIPFFCTPDIVMTGHRGSQSLDVGMLLVRP